MCLKYLTYVPNTVLSHRVGTVPGCRHSRQTTGGPMSKRLRAVLVTVFVVGGVLASSVRPRATAVDSDQDDNDRRFSRVLLISIDGMHAADFANCMTGLPGVNGGHPYCVSLAALAEHGLNYPQASASKPSDSFPGILAMATGGSPRSTGVYYDVSYDRRLSPSKDD